MWENQLRARSHVRLSNRVVCTRGMGVDWSVRERIGGKMGWCTQGMRDRGAVEPGLKESLVCVYTARLSA
jgi:hypothetical protein